MVDILNTIMNDRSLALPVVIIAAMYVVVFILFYNKRDALMQRVMHKRNASTSIILSLVFLGLALVAVDNVHFHITIFWWLTVIMCSLTVLMVYHDMKPMLLVTGNNRTLGPGPGNEGTIAEKDELLREKEEVIGEIKKKAEFDKKQSEKQLEQMRGVIADQSKVQIEQ